MTSRIKFLSAAFMASITLISAISLTSAAPQGKKKKHAAPTAAPTKEMIEAGSKLAVSNGCTACHMIGDKGGKTGPDMSHIGKNAKCSALFIY